MAAGLPSRVDTLKNSSAAIATTVGIMVAIRRRTSFSMGRRCEQNPSQAKAQERVYGIPTSPEFGIPNRRPGRGPAAQRGGGTAMRFGFWHNLQDTTKARDYGELLDEMRELAVMCDEAGFDTFWLPEHHFSVWGRELLPNPILMAADLAARTKRIRIGLAAAIVTFWHPLRAAEDIGMLDHLSGGRLELGVGRGNYGLEAKNLNPIADPNDQMMNIKVFEETVEIIKRALGQERFSFKGDVYQFPAPGFSADRAHSVDDPAYIDPVTKELVQLSIFPGAKQKPLPPMWQVVNSIESIQHAARLDMGIIMWRPGIRSLQLRLAAYREEMRRVHGRDLPTGARTAIMRDTFVAGSEQEAVRVAGGTMMDSLNFSNWRGPSIYLDPGETL